MTTKHSPGPWYVVRGIVTDAYDTRVATPDGDEWAQAQANARLIAAAPDLLGAAKEALATLNRIAPGIILDAKDTLRIAIASAEGTL